jgi:hypothetical protein
LQRKNGRSAPANTKHLRGSQSHVDLIPGFGTLSKGYTSHRHVDLLRVLVSRQEQQTCATDHVDFGLSFRREVRSRTKYVDKYTNLSAMKPGAQIMDRGY